MRHLADIPSDFLIVECVPCRRRGCYQLARLIVRHGQAGALHDVLAEKRAGCAKAPCQAQLPVPMRIALDRDTFPGNRFALDIWEGETTVEMHIGDVQNFEIAKAAFERAVSLWPHSIITVRVGMHAFLTHKPVDERARLAQERIHRWIGGR